MSVFLQCKNPDCRAAFELSAGESVDSAVCPKCQRPLEPAGPEKEGSLLGQTLDGYRLDRWIAKGGMGEVYEAVQLKLDRRVALKVLSEPYTGDPAFILRFEREAKSTAAVNHPNLVQVYDFGQSGFASYLVMEYVDGEDLARYVSRKGRIPIPEALEIARQVAIGLQEALSHGIIHRDIKPSNILLTSKGGVKVSDLGLARRLDDDMDLTISGIGIGSPHFISPEQADDAHKVDHRTDIYSLGITLLFLLTGKRPYDGGTALSIVLAHTSKPLPKGSDLGTELPESVERLIRRMAAKDFQRRYPDYHSLIDDINRVQQGLSPIAVGNYDEEMTVADGSLASPSPHMDEAAMQTTQFGLNPPTVPPPTQAIPKHSSTNLDMNRMGRKPFVIGVIAVLVVSIGFMFNNRNSDEDKTKEDGNSTTQQEEATANSGNYGVNGWGDPLRPLINNLYSLPDTDPGKMLEYARQYAGDNPEQYRTIIECYRQIQSKEDITDIANEVNRELNDWSQKRSVAFKEEFEKYRAKMVENLHAVKPGQAFSVWIDFPDQLRSKDDDRFIRDFLTSHLPPSRRQIEQGEALPPNGGRGPGGGFNQGPGNRLPPRFRNGQGAGTRLPGPPPRQDGRRRPGMEGQGPGNNPPSGAQSTTAPKRPDL